ncbi:hypothetical protein D3C77_619100 [compost metagenome]
MRWGVQIADAQRRQHTFGQAGEVHRAFGRIRSQWLVIRCGFEKTVDIVIDDEQVELAGYLGDGLAPCMGHDRVGRVLVGGDAHQQGRAVLQARRAQCLGNQAVLVHGHAAQAAAHAVGQGDDAWVAERLAQHHIVALRQAADGHQQAVLGP